MHSPHVKVTLDQTWDTEVFIHFLDERDSSYDFGYDRIVSIHPDMASVRDKSEEEKSLVVVPYVKHYYQTNRHQITGAGETMQKLWNVVADRYFLELEKIFGTVKFYTPQEIRASLSIAKAGVIGDDNASFQIWYQTAKEPDEVRRHFAHEILHFYYYAYLKQKGLHTLAENWDLAEIFVVVILGLPQFVALIGKEDRGYEQHERYFPHYKSLWNESFGIDEYLEKTAREGLTTH